MKLKILLSVSLILSSLSLFSKDVFSAGPGDWKDGSTWVDGVSPTADDDVFIRHRVTLNSTENLSVQSVFISNTNGYNASLETTGDFKFYLNGNLVLNCTASATAVSLLLNDNVEMTVAGDISASRNAILDISKLTLDIFGNSSLECDGNFTLEFDGFIPLGEMHSEFNMNDNATMSVYGIATFRNVGGNELEINLLGRSSFSAMGDLVFQNDNGMEVQVTLDSAAKLTTQSDLTVKNLAAANTNIDIYAEGEIAVSKNLNIVSSNTARNIDVELQTATGFLKVEGDINFNATDANSSAIILANRSKLDLKGSITKMGGFGSLSMSSNSEFIFSGSGLQSIQEGDGIDKLVFSNVTFDTGSDTVTLLGNILVTERVLLNNGIVKTSKSALLTLGAGAKIIGGSPSSYIDGPLRKIDPTAGEKFTFPIGDNGKYGPMTIDVLSGRAGGLEYTADFLNCPPPWGIGISGNLDNISATEHWTLDRSDGGQDINVELHWTDADISGINETDDLVVAMYNPDAEIYPGFPEGWTSIGQGGFTGGTGSGSSGTVFNIGSCPPPWGIQDFTFGTESNGSSLPVQMESFDAVLKGEIVNIDWATELEINTDYFEIQKSNDGVDFLPLEKVTTKGYGDYSTQDFNPQAGFNYYRIKKVDLDGMFAFTGVKTVEYLKNIEITAFPNPMQEMVVLKGSFLKGVNTFIISDLSGKVLQTGEIDGSDEYVQMSLDQLNIGQSGIYMLELVGNSASQTIRLMKN